MVKRNLEMTVNRILYDYSPLYSKLTQGSIINGCVAEAFPNKEVFGVIITPRCDLSHDGKVLTVHYVPLVPFELWFDVIAKPIIKELWKKDLANKLDSKFNNAKVGSGIMEADFTYDDLRKIVEQKVLKQKDKEEIKILLEAYFDINELAFKKYLLDENSHKRGHKMFDFFSRLQENSIHSYYLLEGWKEYGENKHLVVMLRDVRRIEYNIANRIGKGVEESNLSLEDTTHSDLFLTAEKNNFYFIQALIASPFIEHIMEAFVYNFSRIGFEDRPGNTFELLNESVKTAIK